MLQQAAGDDAESQDWLRQGDALRASNQLVLAAAAYRRSVAVAGPTGAQSDAWNRLGLSLMMMGCRYSIEYLLKPRSGGERTGRLLLHQVVDDRVEEDAADACGSGRHVKRLRAQNCAAELRVAYRSSSRSASSG